MVDSGWWMVQELSTIHYPPLTLNKEPVLSLLRGAQAIVKCIEREGIEFVFGIPGLYNMPIFDALYRHPTIRVIRDVATADQIWRADPGWQ